MWYQSVYESHVVLPVAKKIPWQDPAIVLRCFADQEWVCFLDSARHSADVGEHSFIVFNPFLRLVAHQHALQVNEEFFYEDPFSVLQKLLARYRFSAHEHLPPFQGGAVGYFSYDLLHYLEQVPRHASHSLALPEMTIGFYDTVIAFRHTTGEAWVISHGIPEREGKPCPEKASAMCQFVIDRLSEFQTGTTVDKAILQTDCLIKSNFDQATYCRMVEKVIDYIHDGDIFQANVSQCFSTDLPESASSMDLYLKLRSSNPAPFAAFLNYGAYSIASASPERFLKLQSQQVETRPVKGTRRRSVNLSEDRRLAHELLGSTKDRAENIMITDLMRNDLSRVCEDHSVYVRKLCGLESYESVHHLVSIIEGKLKPGHDAVDLLRAAFPGGSITGAPKVRAMEIIAELEPSVRGPYCGSIGYIGFDGTMDTSIVIRTFVVNGKTVTFQAGGGIVAESTPEEEYQESLTKASSLMHVLRRA